MSRHSVVLNNLQATVPSIVVTAGFDRPLGEYFYQIHPTAEPDNLLFCDESGVSIADALATLGYSDSACEQVDEALAPIWTELDVEGLAADEGARIALVSDVTSPFGAKSLFDEQYKQEVLKVLEKAKAFQDFNRCVKYADVCITN